MSRYSTEISKFFTILFLLTGCFLSFFSETEKAYAAISFVGSAENSSSPNNDTTVTLSGMGLQEGDLVIVSGAIGDDGGDHNVVINTAGYTEINDLFADDTDDINLAVWWKIMTSTPDTSVVVEGSTGGTDSSLAVVVMAFRGVDQSTPFDVTSTVATKNNTMHPDPASIDHNNPSGLWTVISGASVHILGGAGTYTFPTGYTTNAIDRGHDDSDNDVTVGMGYRSSGISDPEDPGTMTHSGVDLITTAEAAFTMALRPALPLTFEQAAYRFFSNANSTDVGSALVAQDTAATLSSTGDAFRLRTLLHIGDASLFASGQNFKLQFAEKSGTCDTSFSGENYADVTGSTVIAYNNNASPADGADLTANASDPTHGGHTIVNQDYEEANNFTNTVATIPSGQDGKWDFSLIDNGATASTGYCFRVVKSDGTQLNTYTVIPEIIMASAAVSGTLTFSISDNSIGFGTLSSTAARYATGDTTGSTSEVEAHTIAASTNASSGYFITVNGATLISGANTITAIGSSNTISSVGSEQFGLRMSASGGNGAVTSPYAASGFAFDTGSFPDQLASDADGDDVTTTYSLRYLGNISGTTEAGSYSSTLTYIITAGF